MDQSPPHAYAYEYSSHKAPACIAESQPKPDGDFVRSVRWSPDGSALAAATESGALEIHNLSDVVAAYYKEDTSLGSDIGPPALTIPHAAGGLLAYAWYPYMHAQAPETCCLVESTRDHPVHLRDTLTGRVRASYRAHDDKDTLLSATALAFDNAQCFVAGVGAGLARFDLLRPGMPVAQQGLSPARRSRDGMKGLVSCVALGGEGLVACATFAGHVGLRRAADLGDVASWRVPVEYRGAGVTDLCWAGPTLLWAAQRRARYLVAWDVRDLRSPVATVERPAGTAQRMTLAVDGTARHLVAGTMDGALMLYDTATGTSREWAAADDVVAAVAAHPHYPLVATASGQRHSDEGNRRNCMKIWALDAQYYPSSS
ncbi:hypothetical protein FBU31_001599 [Coemansia sp. 'formosensis']|nr:hypothetical protein FBU31_001599 [Coemansia sp. 'formosensis']